VKLKLKTDGSMRQVESDSSTPKITIFIVLCPKGNLVFSLLLGPINRTLEGCDSLLLFQFSYIFLRNIV
jgi:hypothetical protein